MKTEKEKSRPQRAAQATQVRFWNKQTTPLLVLFALGFFLYAYTFSFQYALDDKLYITDNQFTKKGFAGIPDILSQESLVGFCGHILLAVKIPERHHDRQKNAPDQGNREPGFFHPPHGLPPIFFRR